MNNQNRNKGIYSLYEIAIALKGVTGTLEIIFGILLLFTNVVNHLVLVMIRTELLEDPDDYFASHLHAFATQSHQAQILGGLYLVSHGLVKAFLVANLFLKKTWAFPAALSALGLITLYEIIRVSQTHSIPLLIATVFDLFVLALIYYEYKQLPREGAK